MEPRTKEGSVTPEKRSRLRKTAADPNSRIAIMQSHRVAWHANRERWEVFARCERLLTLGERMGLHLGGTFALRQFSLGGRALAKRAGSACPEAGPLS
jgi:hypothetical protein